MGKLKSMSKKNLNNINVEVDEKGFCIWVKDNGKRYWLIDASCLFEDGKIRLGNVINNYKFQAKFSQLEKTVFLTEQTIKNKTL